MLVSEKSLIKIVTNGHITSPKGFSAGGVHCGLRRKKLDFGWIFSRVPASAAGVYTTNSFQAAPLQVTKKAIAVENKLQGIVVNSANANACTGQTGIENAQAMQKQAAEMMNIKQNLIGVSSTGLIGVQLPMEKITEGIQAIDTSVCNPENFEQAILTTDTVTKHAAVTVDIDGKEITIGGAAKGSGMIHPNMATMLAYLTTDACVEPAALQELLSGTTDKTYNMITVDGDSSTNDTVLALANGEQGNDPLTPEHPEWHKFAEAFRMISEILSKKIARDGEGATKLIEINVKNAADESAAGTIAKTVISSNLVKTAVYGADPNWGRVVCAVGYSKEPVVPESLDVFLGHIQVVENGLPLDFSEEEGTKYLENDSINITVDLKQGEADATAWGCDLTYDYVKINASYRT